jgi:hypothetical protein
MEVKEKFQQDNLQQKSEEYKLGKVEILMYKGIICVKFSGIEKSNFKINA